MLKNLFKKHSSSSSHDDTSSSGSSSSTPVLPNGMPDEKNMTRLQRLAWKQFQKMNPQQQRKIMEKAMTPKNIAKHRKEILSQLDAMKQAGMMSDDQYRMARRKLGL